MIETQAMTWIAIAGSKALEAYAYDAASYTLGVMTKATESNPGKPYFYIDVPPEVHQQMMRADSKGSFWLTVIKPKYQCRKGDNTPAQQSPGADPLHPKVERIISNTAAMAPVAIKPSAEALSLAISFEAGGTMPVLPFSDMVDRLKLQMDTFCTDLVFEIDNLEKLALGTVVDDEVSYSTAAELGKLVADKRKFIVELMKPTKKAIDSVKAVVLNKESDLLAIVVSAETRLKKLCTDYRVAEQNRAAAAAEAFRQLKLREAEDKRIAEAEKAQEAGRTVLAEKLLSTPVTAPKVVVEAAVPKVAGTRTRIVYGWRLKDEAAVPRHWLKLDESAIGLFARDSKLADNTVLDGIEFYQEHKTDF